MNTRLILGLLTALGLGYYLTKEPNSEKQIGDSENEDKDYDLDTEVDRFNELAEVEAAEFLGTFNDEMEEMQAIESQEDDDDLEEDDDDLEENDELESEIDRLKEISEHDPAECLQAINDRLEEDPELLETILEEIS